MPTSIDPPVALNGHPAATPRATTPHLSRQQATSGVQSGEVLVRVEKVSKKFCRSLKKSLWYGLRGMAGELDPRARYNRGDHGRRPALRQDEFWAVDDVSFELRRGECLGLIGHNGAGKTTLLKLVNGLLKPDAGRVETRGRVVALIALGAGFNPILTGRENVYVNASVLGLTKREIDEKFDEIVDFAEIREFIDAPVQSYSTGMAVRLGFAVAANLDPDVLLLDEVLAVGDFGFQTKCFNALARFREKGAAFILVSHSSHLIARYCSHSLYLSRGATRHQGDVSTGLAKFLEEMSAKSGREETSGPDWSKAVGTGKVRFTNACFFDDRGRRVESIRSGESVSLAIDYSCRDGGVSGAQLEVTMSDAEGLLFKKAWGPSVSPIGRLAGEGRLVVRFSSCCANSAEAVFAIAIQDAVTNEIYDWKRGLRLRVMGDLSSSGRVHMNSELCVDPY